MYAGVCKTIVQSQFQPVLLEGTTEKSPMALNQHKHEHRGTCHMEWSSVTENLQILL